MLSGQASERAGQADLDIAKVRWRHAVAQVFQVVALEVGKQQGGVGRAHGEFGAVAKLITARTRSRSASGVIEVWGWKGSAGKQLQVRELEQSFGARSARKIASRMGWQIVIVLITFEFKAFMRQKNKRNQTNKYNYELKRIDIATLVPELNM